MVVVRELAPSFPFSISVVIHVCYSSVCGLTSNGLGHSLLTHYNKEASRKGISSKFFQQYWLLREHLLD